MNHKCVRVVVCALALALFSGTLQPLLAQTGSRSKKAWVVSLAALAAANILDMHVSRGQFETNPLLRDSHGRFSLARGILFKSGLSAGAVTVQVLFLRKASAEDSYTPAAVANFAAAGGLTALAIRNHCVAAASAGAPAPR